MTTLIHRRVEEAQQGKNPSVACHVPSGWVAVSPRRARGPNGVLGDTQVTPGYSILLSDPVVLDLNALSLDDRATFLRDMSIVGDALLEVTGAALINYEILGNTDRALHAHIVPRYADEPDEQRHSPIWLSDWRSSPKFDQARDKGLMEKLADSIQRYVHENLES